MCVFTLNNQIHNGKMWSKKRAQRNGKCSTHTHKMSSITSGVFPFVFFSEITREQPKLWRNSCNVFSLILRPFGPSMMNDFLFFPYLRPPTASKGVFTADERKENEFDFDHESWILFRMFYLLRLTVLNFSFDFSFFLRFDAIHFLE